MYGSMFKMRPKAGKAGELRDVMLARTRKPLGMVAAYLLKEDAGGAVWGFGVFADEKTYRDNANDPAQGVEYEKMRALLEADPEWHDGSIDQLRT